MKLALYLALAGILLLSAACQPDKTKEQRETTPASPAKPKTTRPWAYSGETGPEHWAELEEGSACYGQYQSPVNLVNYITKASLPPINFFYSDSTHLHAVANNGHTIQYAFEPGDYINYAGTRYNLVQFHVHEPAEHLIDGIRYPLEVHLVHKSAGGFFAVVSIMAKENRSSPAFSFLESYLPVAAGEEKTVRRAFAMESVLPTNRNYITYEGSLTTPPCTEGVRWLVMREPLSVSLEQLEQLQELMPKPNYRTEQRLNNRQVLVSDL
jgi:carbonic anhydrase